MSRVLLKTTNNKSNGANQVFLGKILGWLWGGWTNFSENISYSNENVPHNKLVDPYIISSNQTLTASNWRETESGMARCLWMYKCSWLVESASDESNWAAIENLAFHWPDSAHSLLWLDDRQGAGTGNWSQCRVFLRQLPTCPGRDRLWPVSSFVWWCGMGGSRVMGGSCGASGLALAI